MYDIRGRTSGSLLSDSGTLPTGLLTIGVPVPASLQNRFEERFAELHPCVDQLVDVRL